jgi:hypothetical protein
MMSISFSMTNWNAQNTRTCLNFLIKSLRGFRLVLQNRNMRTFCEEMIDLLNKSESTKRPDCEEKHSDSDSSEFSVILKQTISIETTCMPLCTVDGFGSGRLASVQMRKLEFAEWQKMIHESEIDSTCQADPE